MTDPHQPTWPAPQQAQQQAQQQSWPAPGQSGQAAAAQRYPAAQVPSAASQGYPAAPQAYAGTPQGYPGLPTAPRPVANTPWAWIIGAIVFAQSGAYLLIDWGAYTRLLLAIIATGAGGLHPAEISRYIAAVAPGWVGASILTLLCMTASVICAFLDHRALTRLGVVQPFHWGWDFLFQPLLYLIGRTVVLNRRGWRGMGPLWVAIAAVIFSWFLSGVMTMSIFSSMT